MLPHNKLTFIRNRHRSRELREFRDLVEVYFDRSERDSDDVAMDWHGAQEARAQINRMLPRIIRIVKAAGIGGPSWSDAVTDPGVVLGRVDVLHRIFTARYGDGVDQEIFDVLDMALGVYDGDQAVAFIRTINPIFYLGRFIAWLTRGPRSLFGFGRRPPAVREADLARLEAVVSRLADVEGLIDSRFAALQDRQAERQAEQSRRLEELAERLDFAERVLARQEPQKRLESPKEHGVSTPV